MILENALDDMVRADDHPRVQTMQYHSSRVCTVSVPGRKLVFPVKLLAVPGFALCVGVHAKIRKMRIEKNRIGDHPEPEPVLVVHAERLLLGEGSDRFVRPSAPKCRGLGDGIEREQERIRVSSCPKSPIGGDEAANLTPPIIHDARESVAPDRIGMPCECLDYPRECSGCVCVVAVYIGEDVAGRSLQSRIDSVGLSAIGSAHRVERHTARRPMILSASYSLRVSL